MRPHDDRASIVIDSADVRAVQALGPEAFATWPWQRCLARHSTGYRCDRLKAHDDGLHVADRGLDMPAWREAVVA